MVCYNNYTYFKNMKNNLSCGSVYVLWGWERVWNLKRMHLMLILNVYLKTLEETYTPKLQNSTVLNCKFG